MIFIGLSSSEQVRRGYWRVVLGGNAFDPRLLLTINPLETWPSRVERWRTSVNTDGAKIPAITSPASVSDNGIVLYGARAVVDVHILGGQEGESTGEVAKRMDRLISGVSVESVQSVNNADSIARDAALGTAVTEAGKSDPLGIKGVAGTIEVIVKLAVIAAAIYAVAVLVKAVKQS